MFNLDRASGRTAGWTRIRDRFSAGLMIAATMLPALPALVAAADEEAPKTMKHDPAKYEIVVSATKTKQDVINVPNAASVVSGAELRRRGTRTLADALQDIVGLDTADGSDNGSLLPNIGMWGLKEFDALLVMVDGVPIGGPFNPSLSQIAIDDVDRIELVKGPQGTLYGVSAFAGMIQIFTRGSESGRGHLSVGGGSFSNMNAGGGIARTLPHGVTARLTGSVRRSDGWQDRTGNQLGRGGLSLGKQVGKTDLSLQLFGYRDNQKWGTPQPWDAGEPIPGFERDRNYAVSGARIEHRVFSAVSHVASALTERHRIENTLSYTRDNQTSLRSFPGALEPDNDTFASAGVLLRPHETTVFDDLRLVSGFDLAGSHQLVTGAAVTWGRTVADGIGFDFDQMLSTYPPIEGLGTIPVGDNRNFEDRRTFFGVYAHDAWTPVERLTLAGGGRYDNTSEKLHAFGQEVGGPAETADDSRSDGAWSGDISALVRLAPANHPQIEALNAYVNWKSSFKPAAPNLTEAEGAEILRPEHTHSVEGGIKSRFWARQLEINLTAFDLKFENLVVSNLGPGGGPELMNAGKERFKGEEAEVVLAPNAIRGLSLALGYAHHDARFVEFTFVTPDSQLRDVSGKKLELVPRDLFNARVSWQSRFGLGLFGAARYQGERPLNRRNKWFDDPYTEWDAGASYKFPRGTVSVTGRNLGDDRHLVSESDIGDSQFYPAAPRRVSAELTIEF